MHIVTLIFILFPCILAKKRLHNPKITQTSCTSNADCSFAQSTNTNCQGTCQSNVCTYDTSQCTACGNYINLKIEVMTDTSANENSWDVVSFTDVTNVVLSSNGEYTQSNTLYTNTACLSSNQAYIFILKDMVGDGMGATGYFKVYVNDILIKQVLGPTSTFLEEEVIICTQDSQCDDGDICTLDTCSNSRCRNEINVASYSTTCPTFGSPTVLALRVVANDASTTATLPELSNYLYGTNGKTFTMSSQFQDCSYSQFVPQAYVGTTTTSQQITNGVAEINLVQNIVGMSAGAVSDSVIAQANTIYGNLEDQFNLVLVCLPPGTIVGSSMFWRAYAFVNSYLSIFNDDSCNYPSVTMHELGHNIGLSHSNDIVNYGDESGMMGLSYYQLDGPRKCYNSVKSYQLGWYKSKQLDIELNAIPKNQIQAYKLVGIEHYLDSDLPNIIRLVNSENGNDYYLHFNSNTTTLNSGTNEGPNSVLLTTRPFGSLYHDSTLLKRYANLQVFAIINFVRGFSLEIEVEIIQDASIPYAVILLEVYINRCVEDEQCDDWNSCTVDTCNVQNGTCLHFHLPCSDCGTMVDIAAQTNNFPMDLTWSIENIDTARIVLSSGYFTEPNTLYEQSSCLEHGHYKYVVSYTDNTTNFTNATPPVEFSLKVTNTTIDSGKVALLTTEESLFIICVTDADCNDFDGCTIDVCIPHLNLCNYTRVSDSLCFDCTWLEYNVTLDNYPDETTFNIQETQTNKLVVEGDPFVVRTFGAGRRSKPTRSKRIQAPTRTINIQNRQRHLIRQRQLQNNLIIPDISERFCLVRESIYRLTIFDSFGDGICCTEGQGSYTIAVGPTIIEQGGNFTTYQQVVLKFTNCDDDDECNDNDACTLDYCLPAANTCYYITRPCSDCGSELKVSIFTDEDPFQTSWEVEPAITNTTNTIFLQDGPFADAYALYEKSQCLPFGSYTFTLSDTFRNGMRNCISSINCGYVLTIDNVIYAQGDGNFDTQVTKTIEIIEGLAGSISSSSSASYSETANPTPEFEQQITFSPTTSSPTVPPTTIPTTTPTVNECPNKHIKKCTKKCKVKSTKYKKCQSNCNFDFDAKCATCPTKHQNRCKELCNGKKNLQKCKNDCNFPVKKNCSKKKK